jgi:hypothetical protein
MSDSALSPATVAAGCRLGLRLHIDLGSMRLIQERRVKIERFTLVCRDSKIIGAVAPRQIPGLVRATFLLHMHEAAKVGKIGLCTSSWCPLEIGLWSWPTQRYTLT